MQKVVFDELIAAMLLRYDKINNLDIDVMVKKLSSDGIDVIGEVRTINYFYSDTELYDLKREFLIKVRKGELKPQNIEYISKYIKSLNQKCFVLDKINTLGVVPRDNLEDLFSPKNIEIILKLFNKGYVSILPIKVDDNEVYSIVLSETGYAKLYMYNHNKEYDDFKEVLISLGMDCDIILEYLCNCNLLNEPDILFNIDAFNYYLCEKIKKR